MDRKSVTVLCSQSTVMARSAYSPSGAVTRVSVVHRSPLNTFGAHDISVLLISRSRLSASVSVAFPPSPDKSRVAFLYAMSSLPKAEGKNLVRLHATNNPVQDALLMILRTIPSFTLESVGETNYSYFGRLVWYGTIVVGLKCEVLCWAVYNTILC